MPNPYFQFKKFRVFQDQCAMKVGTDSVLLGAWTDTKRANAIVDIGTGTGLLALMLAQKTHAHIDAVEIDSLAASQAFDNIQRSPWSTTIHIHSISIQKFARQSSKQYDLIVSNPPFFSQSTGSKEASKRIARHTDHLCQKDLLTVCQHLLAPEGSVSVVFPVQEALSFKKCAMDYGFFCRRKLWVQPKENSSYKRILMEFQRNDGFCLQQFLTVEQGQRHCYTTEYKALTKDYYLAF